MGSLSHQRAQERVQTAIRQRLDAIDEDDYEARERVFNEAISELAQMAIDSVELNRAAKSIAVNPEDIDFPE